MGDGRGTRPGNTLDFFSHRDPTQQALKHADTLKVARRRTVSFVEKALLGSKSDRQKTKRGFSGGLGGGEVTLAGDSRGAGWQEVGEELGHGRAQSRRVLESAG